MLTFAYDLYETRKQETFGYRMQLDDGNEAIFINERHTDLTAIIITTDRMLVGDNQCMYNRRNRLGIRTQIEPHC